MIFDPLYQPYTSNRYCVTSTGGMCATGSHLASAAGMEIMNKGGNAVDAAVAMAAALTVVEPTANGLGADSFAIVWIKDKLYGLNSSGYSPYDISLDKVQERCPDGKMPRHGWLPVMVPGAVRSWSALLKRFGRMSLGEVLEPAVRYAEGGFAVPPLTCYLWERAAVTYKKLFGNDPAFSEWFRTFTNDGTAWKYGEIVRLPGHARTLKLIAETDGDAFYKGEIAEQFVRQSGRDGGYFSLRDLAEYESEWVDPVSINYHGVDVWEIPPNGQGIVALMALNILKEFCFEDRSEEFVHTQLEAMKLAFSDGLAAITDPREMDFPYEEFLKPEYGRMRAQEIGMTAAAPVSIVPPKGGTVYLCTADDEGSMVSYIQSNYAGFGSGIVLEGYGVALQNRGSDFSLNQADRNVLAPHKKSYHTIIPGFLTKDGKALGPFGVMGGYMQPQGHVQVVQNLVDLHLNPQMALDAPRWQWTRGKDILLEPEFDRTIAESLRKRGHNITVADDRISFGRGQIILRNEQGVLTGGTESRTDSAIYCR